MSETTWKRVKPDRRSSPIVDNPLIDVKACAAAVRGDEEWARGALKTYGDEIPGHVDIIRRALQKQDTHALFEVAHSLKGVSRLFQINQIANAAEALEKACSTKDWPQVEHTTFDLVQLLHSAREECNTLRT